MTDQEPTLRVVRGRPTAEELAAVVVVLSALSVPAPTKPPRGPTSGWAARWRGLRTPLRPGPDAWRLSGRR